MYPDRVSRGDLIEAAHFNRLLDQLRESTIASSSGVSLSSLPGGSVVYADINRSELIELHEHLEADDIQKQAQPLLRVDDAWEPSELVHEDVMEANRSVHLKGERHVVLCDPVSGGRVLMPTLQWHLGKTDEAIDAGASGTVSIYEVEEGSEVDSEIDVEAANYFSVAVEAETKCMVLQHRQSGRWYLFAADCPVI